MGPVSISDSNNVIIFVDNPNGYYYAPGVATSTSINNGGVGYAIGDILTPTTGDQSYQIQVTAINGSTTGSITAGGSLYDTGTYTNVPLIGGSGSGAQATIVVGSTLSNGLQFVTATNAGSGYTGTGFYYNVPLTSLSGTGSGATANVQVSGGIILDTLIASSGSGYNIGDTFTINNLLIGGAGTGLLFTALQTNGGITGATLTASGSRL